MGGGDDDDDDDDDGAAGLASSSSSSTLPVRRPPSHSLSATVVPFFSPVKKKKKKKSLLEGLSFSVALECFPYLSCPVFSFFVWIEGELFRSYSSFFLLSCRRWRSSRGFSREREAGPTAGGRRSSFLGECRVTKTKKEVFQRFPCDFFCMFIHLLSSL